MRKGKCTITYIWATLNASADYGKIAKIPIQKGIAVDKKNVT